MDKNRRTNLNSVINKSRKLLDGEYYKQLRYYGIFKERDFIPLEKLNHLSNEEKKKRIWLEESIKKEKLGNLSNENAITRYVRHCSFTFINRIAALRAMEVRKLIKETIIRRPECGGRSLREREIAEKHPEWTIEQLYRENLIQAFEEVSLEIKILFDLDNEYSILFPEYNIYIKLLDYFTINLSEDDWKEDEIIGWIYQYFNSELREEFKQSDRSRYPTADDIPLINQFYTPKWIVKLLVDNSLGRLWFQSHSNSKILEFCDYFINITSCNNDNLQIQKVTDIKILDPSCGSGHFLLYCFDVLFRIYKEVTELSDEEIVQNILENNLFGIDIDLRAIQLAALGLYLKVKSYIPKAKISAMHLVCADIRISNGKYRKQILKKLDDDPEIQEIMAQIFENLQYTFEIGSLLQIRKPFEELFKKRQRKKTYKQTKFQLKKTRQKQFGQEGLIAQTKFHPKLMKEEDIFLIPKKKTLESIIELLSEFEQQAIKEKDIGNLLFYTETEKSVGLLELLTQKYHIILMNPPYGKMSNKTKEYLKDNYQKTYYDLYTAFIELGLNLAEEGGYIGALTSRTFMFLIRNFVKFRIMLLSQAKINFLLDLGTDVLDEATAEWATFLLTNIKKKSKALFFNLTNYNHVSKLIKFLKLKMKYEKKKDDPEYFIKDLEIFNKLPNRVFSYWISDLILEIFLRNLPLKNILEVRQGLSTGNDPKFLRRFWEIPVNFLGSKWVPFSKTDRFAQFYENFDYVIYWNYNGEELKKVGNHCPSRSYYFKKGLTYNYSTNKGFGIKFLPSGSIISHVSCLIYERDENLDKLFFYLGIFSSKLYFMLKLIINPSRKWEVGHVSLLPIKNICFNKDIALYSKEIYNLLKDFDTTNEISTIFIAPEIVQTLNHFNLNQKPQTNHPHSIDFKRVETPFLKELYSIKANDETDLKDLTELILKKRNLRNERIQYLRDLIELKTLEIFKVPKEEILLVEQLKEKLEERSSEMEEESETKNTFKEIELKKYVKDQICRLISYYIKQLLENDKNGIIPINQYFENNLVTKVITLIEKDFRKEKIQVFQEQFQELIGTSLEDWISRDYFNFHVNLYKKKPIFWQLTSYRYGSSRSPPGIFSCLVYYHKLNRDTIPKIQAFYIKPLIEKLTKQKEKFMKELQKAKVDQNKSVIKKKSKNYDKISRDLDELEKFNFALNELHNPREKKIKKHKKPNWVIDKIAEIRDNGWAPVIDYGVRVNIEPLKELKLLPTIADKVK
ncbi:MAG: BREX-1 system adenine-specific DNA-methyltransferase PglX [Candidatus Helarchaeota archaeon]